ncbi:DNA-binding response regulator [Cnuibacter physcomitrellae]|uniref:Uncharacterized protein n=1 Tax=Cnuibacter physcomitrellae TaxID=1619308 RepID=A0A1X9LIN4_9MICO|nr:response regulator transcription factor [Cnuibacter physcomitrellae]ARJ04158.1 hypothetical protein B5808_02140 [Cnuibacter physcomitrellae]GGI40388.1 DNA-binding response regulator [Cnuibacter physcomitrellae]
MTPNSAVRIVVVDDDPLARRAVTDLLAFSDQVHVIAEAHNAATAVDAVRLHRPDVLIIDLTLRGPHGLRAAVDARQLHPGLRVILLTSDAPADFADRARALGVSVILDKADVVDGLLPAVTGAAPPTRIRLVLSEREQAVAELIVAGLSNAEIGARLGLSLNSVKTYTSRLYRKIGVSNRVQLTRLWRP